MAKLIFYSINKLKNFIRWVNNYGSNPLVRLVFFLILVAVSAHYLFTQYQVIKSAISSLQINYLLLIAGWTITFVVMSLIGTSSWWCLIRSLGEDIRWIEGAIVQSKSTLAKYIPGYAWQYIGKAYLSGEAGTPLKKTSIALVFELGLTLITGIALALILIPGEFIQVTGLPIPKTALVVIGCMLILFELIIPCVLGDILNLIGISNIQVYRRYLYGSIVLIIIGWILSGVSFWISAKGLGELGGSFELYFTTLAMALVGGILAIPFPNGIGIREAIIVFMLGSQIGPAHALLLAGVSRVQITSAEIVNAALIEVIRIKSPVKT